jgi:hypothetical protein
MSRWQTQPGVNAVDLWYPQLPGDTPTVLEVQLVHVRAARDIHIQYDFDRDGYAVSAQAGEDFAAPYVEVAFIPAWEDAPGAPTDTETPGTPDPDPPA